MKDITEKELSECDRQQIQYLGNIQGDAGSVIFISYPEGKIIAADQNIRSIPWIQRSSTSTGSDADTDTDTDDDERNNKEAPGRVESMSDDSSFSSSYSNISTGTGTGTGTDTANKNKQQENEDSTCVMLNTELRTWIPQKLYTLLYEGIDEMVQDKSRRSFRFFQHSDGCNQSYAISLSPTTENSFSTIGIEIELVNDVDSPGDFYKTLLSVSRIMERYADEDVVAACCNTVYNLLEHYDRAMVYKFNDDCSGEVVHEIKKETVKSSFLGMRFPAGDIPLPARRLYIKNGFRYIRDSSATDVPILQSTDTADEQLDLSHIRMRSVAKPHVMYLKNMGVKCSMSIGIVVEGKLWGLLSFHGYTKPFKPCLHQRIACETITSMLSVKMEALMKKSQSNQIIKLSEIMLQWEQEKSLTANFERLGKFISSCVNCAFLSVFSCFTLNQLTHTHKNTQTHIPFTQERKS